ncbi:MAG: glycosyltransferase family 39 protein, partial [Candidatus Omnitrophica bacterium]|nr:glycosyltransferase family 39 protein [Candidatus Omnitrophota bacterium]
MKNFKAYLSTILRSEYFLLFLITVAAFLLRLHLLRYRFFPEGDGCHYVAIAKDFINGNFSTVGCHFIGWPFVITGFSLILENIEFSGRIASTILGTFLIPVSYVFAKKLFNRKIAFYTALLVSTNLSLLHYSTLLWPTSAHSLFVMLIALLGWVSLKEKRPFYYFLLGLVIAVSYTIRNEALVYILLFLPLVIIRDYRKAHINVLSLLSGILIVILPLLFFYHNQYGSWEIIRQKGMVNFLYGRGALSYRNVTELTVDFSQNLYMHKANGSFHEAPLKYFFNNFFINRLALNFKEILSDLPKQFFFTKFGGIFISWSLFIYGSYICLLGNRSLRRRYLYILSVPMLAYFVV